MTQFNERTNNHFAFLSKAIANPALAEQAVTAAQSAVDAAQTRLDNGNLAFAELQKAVNATEETRLAALQSAIQASADVEGFMDSSGATGFNFTKDQIPAGRALEEQRLLRRLQPMKPLSSEETR